jgi:hypothetical protein
LAVFARVEGAPDQRSKVSAELAAGIVYQGPFGRDGDNVGLAIDSARVSDPLGSTGAFASQYTFHGYETVFELSYKAQALPWLAVRQSLAKFFGQCFNGKTQGRVLPPAPAYCKKLPRLAVQIGKLGYLAAGIRALSRRVIR